MLPLLAPLLPWHALTPCLATLPSSLNPNRHSPTFSLPPSTHAHTPPFSLPPIPPTPSTIYQAK